MIKSGDMFTRAGRGGQYEYLGVARGAGPIKGLAHMCYRDCATGEILLREPENFAFRMQPVTAPVGGDA